MGPFNHERYRPSWRKRDPVLWRRLAYDAWRIAAVIVLVVIAAGLADWATR